MFSSGSSDGDVSPVVYLFSDTVQRNNHSPSSSFHWLNPRSHPTLPPLPVPLLPSLTSAHLRDAQTPQTPAFTQRQPSLYHTASTTPDSFLNWTFKHARSCFGVVLLWCHWFEALHQYQVTPNSPEGKAAARKGEGLQKLHCCPHVDGAKSGYEL